MKPVFVFALLMMAFVGNIAVALEDLDPSFNQLLDQEIEAMLRTERSAREMRASAKLIQINVRFYEDPMFIGPEWDGLRLYAQTMDLIRRIWRTGGVARIPPRLINSPAVAVFENQPFTIEHSRQGAGFPPVDSLWIQNVEMGLKIDGKARIDEDEMIRLDISMAMLLADTIRQPTDMYAKVAQRIVWIEPGETVVIHWGEEDEPRGRYWVECTVEEMNASSNTFLP